MNAKRANGEGTIYRRSNGRWYGVITVSWQDGRQRRKSVSGRTQAEAGRKLLKLRARLAAGLPLPDENLTVNAWLDRWLESATPALAPKTEVSYRQVVAQHLKPHLERVRLQALNPLRVRQLLDDLAASGVRPPSVKYTLDVLRIALRAAQLADLITRENPASVVKAPTYRRRQAKPFTAVEAQRFLAAVREDRLHALWALGLTAALRRGELLGLQWSDVDLENRRLLIRRQLQRQRATGLVTRAVKTERSEAPVVLTSLAVRALQRHHTLLRGQRLAMGPAWRGTDDPTSEGAFVFVAEAGTPMDPDNVGRRFHALLTGAGLPARRLHDMRHTTATLLHAMGVPAVVARDILRHTDFKTTLGIYTHAEEAERLKAADGLDQLLGDALG